MERLMCLLVESSGEAVEASVNGMPVARLPAGGGRRCVTVHEYLLSGANRIAITVAPPPLALPTAPPQPRLAATATTARARLMLLRQGKRANDDARVLGEVVWSAAEGESFEAPTTVDQALDLPVNFARWRWLDAPPVNPGTAERQAVLTLLQRLAFDLSRGNPDTLVQAARLKFEELALAYQWSAEQAQARLHAQVQHLHEAGALKTLVPPTTEGLLLRPLAGGRLLDCLTPQGTPVLSATTDAATATTQAWPLRLALVEGKAYVLR